MRQTKIDVETQLRRKIVEFREFVLKYSFREKLIGGDDFAYICNFCGEEGYEKLDIKHKKPCEVGKLLNEDLKKETRRENV